MERTYIIPLRRDVNKSPKYKRAKKAVNTVRRFLVKHMKSEDVKLGDMLNKNLWKNGIENPPGKVKVTVTKDDKGIVKAELFGHKFIEKKREKKVEKSKLEQLKEKIAGKEEVVKKEETKEAIKDAPVKEVKEIVKENKDIKGAVEKNIKSQKGIEKSQHKGKE